jgi:hypothetical protein
MDYIKFDMKKSKGKKMKKQIKKNSFQIISQGNNGWAKKS